MHLSQDAAKPLAAPIAQHGKGCPIGQFETADINRATK